MRPFKSLLFSMSLFLVACGGGGSGGDDTSVAPERPAGSISGVAFDGLIINGNVTYWSWMQGYIGESIGSTVTNGQGWYGINPSTSSKPVWGEISGGYYLEEASGAQVQVDRAKGHRLIAVEYYESGKSLEVAATFFSTIAAGYAKYLVGQGVNVEAAIETAYQQVDGWAGFDTRRTVPVDVSDSANVTPYITDSHRYGLVAAAISQLTYQVGIDTSSGIHDSFTSIDFIGVAYRDISSDGVLDGREGMQPITFGNLVITSNTYRELLAFYMLQFVNGDRNLSGLDFADVLPFATQVNLFSGDVFNNTPAPDISLSEPSISQFLPSEGSTISGSFPASVIVADDYGVESVEYFVDDTYVGAGNPSNPVRPIDTLNFSNGPHTITVVVTNFMGNSSSETHNISINNGQLSFSSGSQKVFTSSSSNGMTCPEMRFRVTDTTGLGVEYVKFGESILLLDSPLSGGSAELSSSVSSSCGKITAKDKMGNDYVSFVRSSARRGDCSSQWRGVCRGWKYTCTYSMTGGC